MKHDPVSATPRKAVNLSLDPAVVADARKLGINLSQACERALRSAIKHEREAAWVSDNWDAIQSSNAWVAAHGLPLEKYRMF